MNQKDSAKMAMIEWLSYPGELGKPPSKIECTKQFEYVGMKYYIFKFKKSFFSKWMIAVCGGYKGDSLEHCGHIFSKLEDYNQLTEEKDAITMIEFIRNYWIERAREYKLKR